MQTRFLKETNGNAILNTGENHVRKQFSPQVGPI